MWTDPMRDSLFFFYSYLGLPAANDSAALPPMTPSDCEAMRHSSSEPGLRSDLKSTLEFNALLVFCHLYVCHSRRRSAFFVNSWGMRKITRSWQSGPGSMPLRLSTEKFPACSSRRVKSHYCDFLSFAPLLQRAHMWRRTHVKRHGRVSTHPDASHGRHATHLCRWLQSVSSLTSVICGTSEHAPRTGGAAAITRAIPCHRMPLQQHTCE